jgi:hypothetical protein
VRIGTWGTLVCLGLGVSVPEAGAQGLAVCEGFCAGVGRADITPPPGVGLAGNGPEG